MDKAIPELLHRWLEAGLLDPAQAERIRAFERQRAAGPGGRRLFPVLAISFGALMVGAGVLLFVAAHWAHLAPAPRFLLVLALVGGFHLGGAALAAGSPRTATALHGLGTLALGAGVYLAGQIFNLQEHWPGGLMLWALGAWLGYGLLRDWVQGALAALLTPAWLMGEWVLWAGDRFPVSGESRVLTVGCLLLALTYLSLRLPGRDSLLRRALAWIGGLALLPCACGVILDLQRPWEVPLQVHWRLVLHTPALLVGWAMALGLPLALALAARGAAAWMNAVAAVWALALAQAASAGESLWVYGLCALGASGLILWGLHEARRERVDLGVAGFALTLIAFYFSSLMDKLGRSLGLMGLGLLFLAGGWQLERLRRRLSARIGRGAS